MPDGGANGGEISRLWQALGGLASLCGAGFLFLFAYVQHGKAGLWARVNQQADARVDDARLYATKHDVEALGERLDGAIQQSEGRIMAAIRDRGPVLRSGRGP